MIPSDDPLYELDIPRSVGMVALNLFRKLPYEQVEQPYRILEKAISDNEIRIRVTNEARIAERVLRTQGIVNAELSGAREP